MPTAAKDEGEAYRLQIGGMSYLRRLDGSAQLIHNGVVCNIEKTGTRLRDALHAMADELHSTYDLLKRTARERDELKIRLGERPRKDWDGIPQAGDKDGWHWLQFINTDKAQPYRWDATEAHWVIDDLAGGWLADEVAARFAYRGPCAYPVDYAPIGGAAAAPRDPTPKAVYAVVKAYNALTPEDMSAPAGYAAALVQALADLSAEWYRKPPQGQAGRPDQDEFKAALDRHFRKAVAKCEQIDMAAGTMGVGGSAAGQPIRPAMDARQRQDLIALLGEHAYTVIANSGAAHGQLGAAWSAAILSGRLVIETPWLLTNAQRATALQAYLAYQQKDQPQNIPIMHVKFVGGAGPFAETQHSYMLAFTKPEPSKPAHYILTGTAMSGEGP